MPRTCTRRRALTRLALVPFVVPSLAASHAGRLSGTPHGPHAPHLHPGRRRSGGHPDPRPGIDGSRVLPREAVAPHAADLYDEIRAIPHVVDGIRCHCGCAEIPGMYSLLSCYEASGMAQYCDICQGAGRLVAALHRAGRTLDEIRAEVDRRFG